MKNEHITAKAPSKAAPTKVPAAKDGGYLFILSVVGILVVLAGAAYLLWPRYSERDPEAELKKTPKLNPSTPPGPAPDGMVWVPGGEFWMGGEVVQHNKRLAEDSLPMHKVYVDGFWMDKHEVTNERWAEFAKDTGYLTIAEQKPDPRDFPDAKKEDLEEPFSLVFTVPKEFVFNLDVAHMEHRWWSVVKHASWKQPEGKGSDVKGKEKYPVVHIAYVDAVEYCRWLSKKTGRKYRLPTEAEWEFAGRGGLDRKVYTWGDELNPDSKWMANIWQGRFPNENSKDDGYAGLAPVGSYPPNGYGIHDMAGNAWEWCLDYYHPDYYESSPKKNPKGPVGSTDPAEPQSTKRVQRGGSYLCADNYCIRYQVAARGKGEEKSGASHTGFRCLCEAK